MAVPIIPARDVDTSTSWYRDTLGFDVVHVESEYGIVERDEVGVHFWGPSGIAPEESTTMFRIRVEGIDELYDLCARRASSIPVLRWRRSPGARESSRSPTSTGTS
jgi:catechol 2,3-dioxygenase-like lactoylglutathione lyase family enzyme